MYNYLITINIYILFCFFKVKQSIVSVPSFEFETDIDDITSTYINANFINV